MISVRNLTKSYALKNRRHYVFKNVSFDFPADKNIGILGPNGAGKSTLLRILGGIDHPDSGEIHRNASISWPLGLRGGFVGHMSGRENCRMICNAYGIKRNLLNEKINYIKELSKIGDYFEQPVAYYSSGMGSRLGFALSMAFDFEYFLIDEITAVGDAHFKKLAKEALEKKRATSNIIMVSHSMGDLKRFCDVAVFIKDGTVTIYEDFDKAIEAYLPKTDVKASAASIFKKREHQFGNQLTAEEDSKIALIHRLIADRLKIVKEAVKRKEELGGRAEDTLFKAASLLQKLGQFENALLFCERAIELDDCRIGFWITRANLLKQLQRFEDSKDAIRSGLKLDPMHPALLFTKGKLLFNENEILKAEKAARLTLRANPGHIGAWQLLAEILIKTEKNDEALDAIEAASEINSESVQLLRLKSQILSRSGDFGSALSLDRKVFENKPPIKSDDDWRQLAERLLDTLENIDVPLETT